MDVSSSPIRLHSGPFCGQSWAFGLCTNSILKRPEKSLKCTQAISTSTPSISSHAAASLSHTARSIPTRVLILGGTGRVGAQTARALTHISKSPTRITVAGRNEARGKRVVLDVQDCVRDYISKVTFEKIDIIDKNRLEHLIQSHDIVVHTAGPFQRRSSPNEVLRAAIKAGKDYIDICDDVAHAKDAKTMEKEAKRKDVRAIICAGIYPGISNMAAAEAASLLPNKDPDSIQIFYYTAGSGGIGATVLASTFLILNENAVCFGKEKGMHFRPAASDPQFVGFGGKVGGKTTYMLNLPEVSSLYDTILAPRGGGEAWAKFSTGPPFWNWLLQVMARFGPKHLMGNQIAMQKFALFSLPMVRFVDMFSGARTCFLVKVTGKENDRCTNPHAITAIYEHESLERSVGEATAAFVVEMVQDRMRTSREVQPGIHYPEELCDNVRQRIVSDATLTADRYIVE